MPSPALLCSAALSIDRLFSRRTQCCLRTCLGARPDTPAVVLPLGDRCGPELSPPRGRGALPVLTAYFPSFHFDALARIYHRKCRLVYTPCTALVFSAAEQIQLVLIWNVVYFYFLPCVYVTYLLETCAIPTAKFWVMWRASMWSKTRQTICVIFHSSTRSL